LVCFQPALKVKTDELCNFFSYSFPIRYFGELRTTLTIEPKFGIISLAEFSRQDLPLEGSYIAPLMSVFEVPPLDSSQEKGFFF
jgi:hypothetical protein